MLTASRTPSKAEQRVVVLRRERGTREERTCADAFKCAFTPYGGNSTHLESCLSRPPQGVPTPDLPFSVTTDAYWGSEPHMRHVLHTLCVAGGPPDVSFKPVEEGEGRVTAVEEERGSFKRIHEECTSMRQALVIHIHESFDLVLAPTKVCSGEDLDTPMFLGWLLATDIPSLTRNLLSNSRVVLVLDLDHTLVESHDICSLAVRKEQCGLKRHELCMRLANEGLSLKQREDLELSITALEKEDELLEGDIKMLREFSRKDSVSVQVDKMRFSARPETAYTDDGSEVQRPVIRLPDGSILTRIDPLDRKTSTIVRVRPGWNVFRQRLLEKSRFDIYVCTHAIREYALEVWRLLDPCGRIIPQRLRQEWITNVQDPCKKTILSVLSKCEGSKAISEGSVGGRQFPLAVIVDDRKDAWEEASQSHILQVTPFMYHSSEAACIVRGNTTVAQSDKVLDRTSKTVFSLRSNIYERIDKTVRPEMDKIADRGLQGRETDLAGLLPRLLSVPDLLQGTARAEGQCTQSSDEDAAAGAPATQITPEATAAAAPAAAGATQDPSTAAMAQGSGAARAQSCHPAIAIGSNAMAPSSRAAVAQGRDAAAIPQGSTPAIPRGRSTTAMAQGSSAALAPSSSVAMAPGSNAAIPQGGTAAIPRSRSTTAMAQGSSAAIPQGSNAATPQGSPSAIPQGRSTDQGVQPGTDGSALGNVDDGVRSVFGLSQADPLLLQVMYIIVQLMQAKPDCRHMAEYVIGACEKRPSFLPRVTQCLGFHPALGLLSVYNELQVEELSTTKMAALAAAQGAFAQLTSSQAEVEKLKEQISAQAKAQAAAEVAAAQFQQTCLKERDDTVKRAKRKCEEKLEEQVSKLKAEASSLTARALAAEQKNAQLEEEMAKLKADLEGEVELVKEGLEGHVELVRADLEGEMARIKAEHAQVLSAAERKVEQLQAQLAKQHDTKAEVAKAMRNYARTLEEGSGRSSSTEARSRKRSRGESNERLVPEQKKAATASANEDKVDSLRGTRPRSSFAVQQSRKTPASTVSPTYS